MTQEISVTQVEPLYSNTPPKKRMTQKIKRQIIRSLFIVALVSVVLVVSTYAWFVGIDVVKIQNIEISVKVTEGLAISIDGTNWYAQDDQIEINGIKKTLKPDHSYEYDYTGSIIYDGAQNPNVSKNNRFGYGEDREIELGNYTTNGMYPISTVGQIDPKTSRLIFYEKNSLTYILGGYILKTTRAKNTTHLKDSAVLAGKTEVSASASDWETPSLYDNANHTSTETDGYVVFDLYIKNITDGKAYAFDYNPLEDEAIYLTSGNGYTGSIQKDSDGNITKNDYQYIDGSAITMAGLDIKDPTESENALAYSTRVAFMQIGRVFATETNEGTKLHDIVCSTGATQYLNAAGANHDSSAVTSLCNKKGLFDNDSTYGTMVAGYRTNWNIWEPNDTKHTDEVKDNYIKQCLKRTGVSTYSTTKCDLLTQAGDVNYHRNQYITTYAAGKEIRSDEEVNIYDGINAYTKNTTTGCEGCTERLKPMQYYTDTNNLKSGSDITKEALFYLAPNSITKVRVYIYLEGQDVDSYDITGDYNTIKVAMGFTKSAYRIDEVDEVSNIIPSNDTRYLPGITFTRYLTNPTACNVEGHVHTRDCYTQKNLFVDWSDLSVTANGTKFGYNAASITSVESALQTFKGNKYVGKVVIPDGTTSIAANALENCDSLEMVDLPSTITSIGARAFAGSKVLSTINFAGTQAEWNAVPKGSNWNAYKEGTVTNLTVHCSDGNITVAKTHES